MSIKRNQKEFQTKLQAEMYRHGVDALLLTGPDTIYYATGYASSGLWSSWTLGYCMAFVPAEGECEVIMIEMERRTAELQCRDIKIHTYPTWIYIEDEGVDRGEKPEQPDMNVPLNAIAEIVLARYPNGKIGMELVGLPHQLYLRAEELFGDRLCDGTTLLRQARTIKTEWEIDLLRRAAKSAERAMYEVAGYVEPGWTDKMVMDAFREACYRQDPDIDGFAVSTSFGRHYSAMEIARGELVIQNGDVIRLDIGPCIQKYNSDVCRTFVIGEPSEEQAALYRILKSAHDFAVSRVGPGMRMCDLFDDILRFIRAAGYPNYNRGHFGHSIGCSKFCEEYPFIAPNNPMAFEPGMVFSIETPFYSRKLGGYNLEDSFLVTESGVERWTHLGDDLKWGRKYREV